MLKTTLLCLAGSFALAPAGGPCSDLAVTGSGAPGTTLTFALTGAAANAPAVVVVGPNTGSTTFRLGPIGTLELGLAPPFVPLPLGVTDAQGDASRSVDIPDGNIPRVDLHAQGFTVEMTINRGLRIEFCTSNVDDFSVGA